MSRAQKLRPAKVNEPNRMVKMKERLKKGGDALPAQGQRIVSIAKLVPDPDNERKDFDREVVKQMAESIKQIGIVEPITATPVADGLYMILSGHTRFEAAKLAGLSEVEITLRKPESASQRRRQSLVSNIHRKDLSALETAEALQKLMDDGNAKNQSALAKSIGKSRQWVADMMAVRSLPEDLRTRLQNTPFNIANDTIIRIARLGDDRALQDEIVSEVEAGAKMGDVREKIRDRKATAPATTSKDKKGGVTPGSAAGLAKPKNKIFIGKEYDADVIVQSKTTDELTWERQRAVLRAALDVVEAKLFEAPERKAA